MRKGVLTRWVVLTGAPGSGKSTLLGQMSRRGYSVVEEVARSVLATLSDHERGAMTPEQFQRRLVPLMCIEEAGHDASSSLILDRAVPDVLGFLAFHGLDASWAVDSCREHRYDTILLLEPVPESLRSADQIALYQAVDLARLQDCLRLGYEDLGYEVVSVPFLPIEERLNYVLDLLRCRGWP